MSRTPLPSRSVPRLALALAVAAGVLGAAAPASGDGPGHRDRTLQDPAIVESSGLARSGYDDKVLWTHNDSGDGPRLFAVDRAGRTAAVLTLAGVAAVDWEALSRHKTWDRTSWLYVGDIGDNARVRPEVVVHRVAEPTVLADTVATPESFRLRYEDGPHDAEALLVHPADGRVFVVTKDGAGVYAAPAELRTDEVNVLTRVAPAPRTVTDGAFLYDGRMVLRDYTTAHVSRGLGLPSVEVPLPPAVQGESLAVAPGAQAVLVGSEGRGSAVHRVRLPLTLP